MASRSNSEFKIGCGQVFALTFVCCLFVYAYFFGMTRKQQQILQMHMFLNLIHDFCALSATKHK